MRINLYFGTLHINLYKNLTKARTIGIRNQTSDGQRVIFLDYDNYMYEEQLVPEIRNIQKKYGLSDFYIFKSSQKPESYHAICLDKVTPNEFMQILIGSSCDERFKTMSLKDYKAWVLRIGQKGESKSPEYYKTIKSKWNKREKSLAHAKFLKLQYSLKTEKLLNLDNNKIIIITSYDTISNIKEVKET